MKISAMELKFIRFLEKHKFLLLYAMVTLLSMAARFLLRGLISGDMEWFLLPWARVLKERGGILALDAQVGNYGVLYQTIISLMTYLPIQYEYSYKIFSILFDYALAIISAAIVKDYSGSRIKSFLTYALITMLPTVILNSSAWGQCDSVYVFFCMLCIWLMLRGKYTLAFLSYGVAFAFKLQAIFLAPFLIFYYLKEKKFSIFEFLLVPLIMLLSSIAGILEGRDLLAPFQIYHEQTGFYASLYLNYPSFWALMTTNNVEEVYHSISGFCIVFTVFLLSVELILQLKNRNRLSTKALLFSAFLMTYTCVLFLPNMHDRYSYIYVILGLILAILEPKTVPAFIGLTLLDLQTYGTFLFDPARFPVKEGETVNLISVPLPLLSLINLACFLSYVFIFRKQFFSFGSEKQIQRQHPEQINNN